METWQRYSSRQASSSLQWGRNPPRLRCPSSPCHLVTCHPLTPSPPHPVASPPPAPRPPWLTPVQTCAVLHSRRGRALILLWKPATPSRGSRDEVLGGIERRALPRGAPAGQPHLRHHTPPRLHPFPGPCRRGLSPVEGQSRPPRESNVRVSRSNLATSRYRAPRYSSPNGLRLPC